MDSETKIYIEKLAEKNNPANMLKNVWVFVVAFAGIVFGYAQLNGDVQQNTEAISSIQSQLASVKNEILEEIEKGFDEVSDENGTQDDRFGLYLESLRILRTETEDSLDELDAKVSVLGNRVTILETK